MWVDEDAEQVTYDGQTVRFCSDHCRRRFEQEPDRFLNSDGGASGHAHAH